MQEVANGTFNYSTLSEIMPMIYKRFTEKSAEEWRQIYKSLQLLEFLIKNGSERVIDDARSHLSLLKMLRQFHYIDQNGKDQGINVRNRSKELTELLGDVDRIRAERKKARSLKGKTGGVEGGAGVGGSSNRFGGFGSESGGGFSSGYGGFSGGVYGDGGGFGGQQSSDDYGSTQNRRDQFEEYDEYDEEGTASAPRRNPPNRTTPAPAKQELAKPKPPEVDLFDFGDDEIPSAPPAQTISNGKAPAAPLAMDDFGALQSSGGDDEFDDFQQAAPSSTAPTPSTTSILAPSLPTTNITAISSPPKNSSTTSVPLMSPPPPSNTSIARPSSTANYSAFKSPLLQSSTNSMPLQSPPSQPLNQTRPSGYQPQGPNYFGSISASNLSGSGASTPTASTGVTTPSLSGTQKPTISQQAKKPVSSGDPFASLNIGGAKKQETQKGPIMADMAKQRTDQALWGTSSHQSTSGLGNTGDLI